MKRVCLDIKMSHSQYHTVPTQQHSETYPQHAATTCASSSSHSSPPETPASLPGLNLSSYKPHPSIRQSLTSYIVLIFCSAFVFFSLCLSVFQSSSTRADSRIPQRLPTDQTPPLNYRQRNDLTWNEEKCRNEFPLFYDQLEQNKKAWTFKGGITKDQVQKAKDGNSERWGYARVSTDEAGR